jgi:tRNA 2-selenouridine synthase SelU
LKGKKERKGRSLITCDKKHHRSQAKQEHISTKGRIQGHRMNVWIDLQMANGLLEEMEGGWE